MNGWCAARARRRAGPAHLDIRFAERRRDRRLTRGVAFGRLPPPRSPSPRPLRGRHLLLSAPTVRFSTGPHKSRFARRARACGGARQSPLLATRADLEAARSASSPRAGHRHLLLPMNCWRRGPACAYRIAAGSAPTVACRRGPGLASGHGRCLLAIEAAALARPGLRAAGAEMYTSARSALEEPPMLALSICGSRKRGRRLGQLPGYERSASRGAHLSAVACGATSGQNRGCSPVGRSAKPLRHRRGALSSTPRCGFAFALEVRVAALRLRWPVTVPRTA